MVEIGVSTGRIEVLLRGACRFGYRGVPAGEDGRDLFQGNRLSRGQRDLDVVTAAVAVPHDSVGCVSWGIVAPDGAAGGDSDRDM
jgi:hypothetical protein